ncbi:MAG: sodium:solute symporter, partial [Bacteroidota bacterium]|nr:sodium:solute symporter [Bacteroidota bacterium]
QKLQLLIVLIGMGIAGYLVVHLMPSQIGLAQALHIGGHSGKMNIITFGMHDHHFDWNDKYNIWSGIIGGFFLALSYFGTDHSQVGRYLTAQNTSQGKKGLLINGIVKVPMQFLILLLGVLVFSFYQFHKAPLYFNQNQVERAKLTPYRDSLISLETEYAQTLPSDNRDNARIKHTYEQVLSKALPGEDINDTNYIFLKFVLDYLPEGLVGLLIAIIFLASWGSIAAALNALAACTVVDIHKKFFRRDLTEKQDYRISKLYTLAWGLFSIGVAEFASNLGNSLIETVNILGSLFYGVILGIFLVAFWFKRIKANAVFFASVVSEILVILIYRANVISFLWLNVIGAILVILLGFAIQEFRKGPPPKYAKISQ